MTRQEALVARLTADLRPVRRVPPMGAALLTSYAVGLLALTWAMEFSLSGLAMAFQDAVTGAVSTGLLLGAVGAMAAAAASGFPDRRVWVRRGRILGVLGLSLAGLVSGAATSLPDSHSSPLGSDGVCLGRGVVFGLAPLALLTLVHLRGWVTRPGQAAWLAAAGALALGGLAAHFSCPFFGPRHALIGHALLPWLFGGAFALPAYALLRWQTRV